MDIKDFQKIVKNTFETNFGYTPLTERIQDIQREFFELMRYTDIPNLKEETGDLISSLVQLCNESGWDLEEMINENVEKINSRSLQYKSLGRKTKVAIFGGAFNPITLGHIQSAQFVLNTSKEFDEVWLMPAYKHMYNKELLPAETRLEMCETAAKVDGRIKVFDYEIRNELSGETYNLFKRLKQDEELNKKYNFSMIIGLDNANTFDKWVNYDELERMARFVVIPRKGYERDLNVDWFLKQPHIYLNCENSIIDVSSTLVRNMLKRYYAFNNKKVLDELADFLHIDVIEYIIHNKLYF
jgi:nicotinate-nucleotide adenylyltransferase